MIVDSWAFKLHHHLCFMAVLCVLCRLVWGVLAFCFVASGSFNFNGATNRTIDPLAPSCLNVGWFFDLETLQQFGLHEKNVVEGFLVGFPTCPCVILNCRVAAKACCEVEPLPPPPKTKSRAAACPRIWGTHFGQCGRFFLDT